MDVEREVARHRRSLMPWGTRAPTAGHLERFSLRRKWEALLGHGFGSLVALGRPGTTAAPPLIDPRMAAPLWAASVVTSGPTSHSIDPHVSLAKSRCACSCHLHFLSSLSPARMVMGLSSRALRHRKAPTRPLLSLLARELSPGLPCVFDRQESG